MSWSLLLTRNKIAAEGELLEVAWKLGPDTVD